MTRDEVVKSAFRYQDALFSYAYAVLRDWTLAEDVVQDAFIVVMNKWEDYRTGTSVFAWVRQIVRNKMLEMARVRARGMSRIDEELLGQVALTLDHALDEPAARRQSLMREALQQCMSALNQTGVEILAGFYARAESCEEIATTQNRSVNAVRLSLSRLRRQLHECMLRRMAALEARG